MFRITLSPFASLVILGSLASLLLPYDANMLYFSPMVGVQAFSILTTRSLSVSTQFATEDTSFSSTSAFSLARSLHAKASGDGEDDDDEEDWDANVDYEKEWPKQQQQKEQDRGVAGEPDPTTAWDALPEIQELLNTDDADILPRLGINIGSQLEPLTEKQAAELRAEATEIINDAVAAGIDDIEKLRSKMKREMEASKRAMNFASELRAQEEASKLNAKIDKLAGKFLKDTKDIRASTKIAAQASYDMSQSGRGLDMGTWGTLRDGRTVVADDAMIRTPTSSVLGSVQSNAAKKQSPSSATQSDNRILIIADTKQDKMAKALIDGFIRKLQNDDTLQNDIPNIQVDVLSPTSTIPLGGNNAACVIVFCTSITQDTTLKAMIERLLRKTYGGPGGDIGRPPTQFIGVSSVGTTRTDKFPYSMQNLMGGKLDQRRQIEEAIINTIKQRSVDDLPLDYTIIKYGEIKPSGGSGEDTLSIQPGDVIDDPITAEAAIDVLVQAVAFQPFARNATFCASGSVGASKAPPAAYWMEQFLCLDGPELLRYDIGIQNPSMDQYNELVEYIQGWAELTADSGKGLTTPVVAEPFVNQISRKCVLQQDGSSLLFKPTRTGKNYMSSKEERQRDKDSGGSGGSSTTRTATMRRTVREGGVDVVVELVESVDQGQRLRVRARRCNYADDAVIKELSEQTIIKRLQDAMAVWERQQ